MPHKLDTIHIPESSIFINDLSIADDAFPFETIEEVAQATTGKNLSQGRVFPL